MSSDSAPAATAAKRPLLQQPTGNDAMAALDAGRPYGTLDIAALAGTLSRRSSVRGWLACGLVVLAIHAAALVALLLRPAPPPTAGETAAIAMELPPLPMEQAEALESADAAQSAGPSETLDTVSEITPPEEVSEAVEAETVAAPVDPTATADVPPDTVAAVDAETAETSEATPVETEPVTETEAIDPAAVAADTAEVAAVPLPPEMPARPMPEEKPPEPVRKPPAKEKPRAIADARVSTKTVAPRASANSEAAAGEASQVARTASAAAARDFGSRVRAAIERRKRFPSGVASGGVASVRFTIDRSGTVLSASVVRSAGHPDLDAAALGAVRSASIPPIPAEMDNAQLTITVPINFRH